MAYGAGIRARRRTQDLSGLYGAHGSPNAYSRPQFRHAYALLVRSVRVSCVADNLDGGSLNATNGHKLGTNEPLAKAVLAWSEVLKGGTHHLASHRVNPASTPCLRSLGGARCGSM